MPTKQLTELQRYVLDNLERVVELPYRQERKPNSLTRYQLDGKECSAQITSLVVQKYVREEPNGTLIKLQDPPSSLRPSNFQKLAAVGERRA